MGVSGINKVGNLADMAHHTLVQQHQYKTRHQGNQQKVGKTFKVLFDKKEGDYFVGRTEFDSPEVDNEVLVKANKSKISIGSFANVKITSAEDYDLIGEIV